MVMPIEPDYLGAEAAFTLQDADRFYKIITSGDIRITNEPGTVSVITFFVIRRTIGVFDAFIIHKIFEPSGNVRRQVQSKLGIRQDTVDVEVKRIYDTFATVLSEKTKLKIIWNELDLSAVTTREKQIKKIKNWGGVGIKKA